MSSIGLGVEFFARFAESAGGLAELRRDVALMVLPEQVRDELSVPEELVITEDPEAAREDGLVLVAPGHPLLTAAARSVLERGDLGSACLARTTGLPPARDVLEAKARGQIPVDHGRLDLPEAPSATNLDVVRAAALVTYAISIDERIQEVEEVWVDAATCHEVPHALRDLLRSAALESGLSPPIAKPSLQTLQAVDALLRAKTAIRRERLARETSARLEQRLGVLDDYYERMLASLEDRRSRAVDYRAELLSDQMQATKEDWSRRRAEVAEELTPTASIRPFRLHVLEVPAYEVEAVVRRGSREYRLPLTFVQPTASFLIPVCPSCGAMERLVAAKDRLGCRSCVVVALEPEVSRAQHAGTKLMDLDAARSALADVSSARASGSASAERSDKIAPASPHSPSPHPSSPHRGDRQTASPRVTRPSGRGTTVHQQARTGRVTPKGTRPGSSLNKTGLRLAVSFWSAVQSGQLGRRSSVKIVRGSPMEALVRLYGPAGPSHVVGLEGFEHPDAIATVTSEVDEGIACTEGNLELAKDREPPFRLFWREDSGALLEIESFPLERTSYVLSFREVFADALRERLAPFLGPPPLPVEDLDPTATVLLEHASCFLGLAYAARCLAAWWYVSEGDGPFLPAIDANPAITAAAVESVVTRRMQQRGNIVALAGRYDCPPDAVRRLARKWQAKLAAVSGLRW